MQTAAAVTERKEIETPQELLALASKGERAGPERGWEDYAKMHPQQALHVTVCEGRRGWLEAESARTLSRKQRRQAKKHGGQDERGVVGCETTEDESLARLSVVSWNILSDTWCRHGNFGEMCAQNTPLDWTQRRSLILEWIDGLAPSVLALQEVDFVLFATDLLPELQKRGYEGMIQMPKKLAARQPCGCATFWQRDGFHLVGHCHKSRALAVHLKLSGARGEEVVVVNVHLQAQSDSTAQATLAGHRARQLNSSLEWAAREARGVPVVISGDFNADRDSSLLHVLRSHAWHGHVLSSAYEHPAAAHTLPASLATFAGAPGCRLTLDHIFYSSQHLQLVHLLQPLCAAEARRSFCSDAARILPDRICPSDHLPIAAVLRFMRGSLPAQDKDAVGGQELKCSTPKFIIQ